MANKEILENVEMNKEVGNVESEASAAVLDSEENSGLQKKEKIVIVVIAILLFLLFIGLLVFGMNRMTRGGLDARETSGEQYTLGITSDSRNDSSSENDSFGTTDSDDNSGNNDESGKSDIGSHPGQSIGDNDISGNNTDTDFNQKDYTDTSKPITDPDENDNSAGKDDDTSNLPDDNDDKNDDEQDNDAAPEYAGETKVRISQIDADTGVISITVDDEKIVVPVQTTVFNGRITKSGVTQGKMFGYNCGVTIMLFYPEDEGFNQYEVNGYMSRNTDGLTVLVDINGTDSKLLIKINGMKTLL